MDEVRNPYAPGAGRPPTALVGRDQQLRRWTVALQRSQVGRTAQPMTLYGLRGVGKTVLLSEFAKVASSRDWIVAKIEAGAGKTLRESLGEALHPALADLSRPTAGGRLRRALKTAASFKASYDPTGTWSFGLDLTATPGGGADTGRLETDLNKLVKDLSGAAQEESVGLALLIDEAQDLGEEELTALCAVAHDAGQLGWPLVIALAGLPSLPRVLAEAKSYAERLFVFEEIKHLDEQLAWEAITQPAEEEAVLWDDGAVRLVIAETSGYPYFIQQFGQEAWNEAEGPTITLGDAKVGAARGRQALDVGFFRARWDRATKAEQAYLRAMAVDGNLSSSSGEVANRLGRRASSLGPARAALIAKGLIYAPEHGIVAFTVPGMAEFILRQPS